MPRCTHFTGRAAMVWTLALFVAAGAGSLSPRAVPDDQESPAQREARLAAEFVMKTRANLEGQSGYHVKGTFRLGSTAAGAVPEELDFTGVVRANSVTSLTLKGAALEVKGDVPAFKGMQNGVVRLDDKTGWVDFEQLPTPILTRLVQSPPEVLNLIWVSAVRVDYSTSKEKVGDESCHLMQIPLSDLAVRSLLPRLEVNEGLVAPDKSSAHASLWISDEGLIYRVDLHITAVATLPPTGMEGEDEDGGPAPGFGGIGTTGEEPKDMGKPRGLVTHTYDVRFDVTDYGKNVEFSIPPEAERRLR